MGINITDVTTFTETKVTIRIEGGPEAPVQYLGRNMLVDYVGVTYRYAPEREWWMAVSVTVAGQRLLKPGPNGEQRIGKDRHKSTYGGWSRDVQEAGDLPDWLDPIVSELRPSGAVALPGV